MCLWPEFRQTRCHFHIPLGGGPVTAAQPVTLKGEKGVCWSQTKMLIKMKMSFANTLENQDRFIEALIQENQHPVPKSVKIIFDKNPNVFLHIVCLLLQSGQTSKARSIPPSPSLSPLTSILPLSFLSPFLLFPPSRLAVGEGQELHRKEGRREVCPRW